MEVDSKGGVLCAGTHVEDPHLIEWAAHCTLFPGSTASSIGTLYLFGVFNMTQAGPSTLPSSGTFKVRASRTLKEMCSTAPEGKKRKREPESLVGLKCKSN